MLREEAMPLTAPCILEENVHGLVGAGQWAVTMVWAFRGEASGL